MGKKSRLRVTRRGKKKVSKTAKRIRRRMDVMIMIILTTIIIQG